MSTEKHACRPDTLVGPWSIDQTILDQYESLASTIISTGQLEKVQANSAEQNGESLKKPYQAPDADGISKMSINGAMTRYPNSFSSLFGGTFTLAIQQAFESAKDDPAVKAMFVTMDTPGGMVLGSEETADAMEKFTAAGKRLYIHATGSMTSLGYRFGVLADRLTADPVAQVANVGAMARITDRSGYLSRLGIKAEVIANTGADLKGAFAEGTPVTDAHRAMLRGTLDDLVEPFHKAVQSRRKLTDETWAEVKRAGVFIAPKALSMGLIDAVCFPADALSHLKTTLSQGGLMTGHAGGTSNTVASQNMETVMLTAEQLTQLKSLPGCSAATTDNAAAMALSAALSLQTVAGTAATENIALATKLSAVNTALATAQAGGNKPAPDGATLALLASGVKMRMQSAVEKKAITPAVADAMYAALVGVDASADGKTQAAYNVAALSTMHGGQPLAAAVFDIIGGNTPGITTGGITGSQAINRVAPGDVTNPAKEGEQPKSEKHPLEATAESMYGTGTAE